MASTAKSAAAAVGTAAAPSAAARKLLQLMGKGWTFTNYPASGAVQELQLRNGGATVAYLHQRSGSELLTVRYRQHGLNLPQQQVTRKLAQQVKAHQAAYAAAQAKRSSSRSGKKLPTL